MKLPDACSPVLALLTVAAAGLALCMAGLALQPRTTLAGWLTITLFLLGLPLGAMTILMVHGLTGGKWGSALLPPLRAILATLPLALLLLLPLLARLDLVFPWAGIDPAALPETVRLKLAYLNVPFFLIRFTVCCVAWLVLAWLVLGWTAEPPRKGTGGRGYAIGLIVHGFAVTVFAIDWMLSLEPGFTSTIYAMLEASAQVVGAYALAMAALAAGRAVEIVPGGEEDVALGEDIANMLFGLVLMWAYLAFMQWLVIWGGDLPDEIHWYIIRSRHGWQYALWLMIALAFAVPFAGFLSRGVKRSHRGLLWLAGVVLAGHFIETVWRFRPSLPGPGWPDLAALAGAGASWAALFLALFARPERIVLRSRRSAHG